jgi:hypothetical protein
MARPSAPLSFGDTASASLPSEVRHWIVKSGNDGHKVKEREWSLRGGHRLSLAERGGEPMKKSFSPTDLSIPRPQTWNWVDTVIVCVSVTIGAMLILGIALLSLLIV